MGGIVLHNIAVKLRLPMPDEDDDNDSNDDSNDGTNEGGVPTLTGQATWDRLVQWYFSGYKNFQMLLYFLF